MPEIQTNVGPIQLCGFLISAALKTQGSAEVLNQSVVLIKEIIFQYFTADFSGCSGYFQAPVGRWPTTPFALATFPLSCSC